MRVGEILWINPYNLHHHKVKWEKAYKYAKLMEGGTEFPPVKVYVDLEGKLLVSDGAHRSAAGKMIREDILVEIIGMASVEDDYSNFYKTKPKEKDFWHKRSKK